MIGDNVMIAPNIVISASNHGINITPMRFQSHTYGAIIIADDLRIGSNAVITFGVVLANDVVVGVGVVVTKSTEPYSIVRVPARNIRERV